MDESSIIGYVDPLISSPGDKPAVKVSCSRASFTSQVFRLRAGYQHPHAPPISHQVVEGIARQTHGGKPQFSRIGSFARIDSWNGALLGNVDSISISFWCQATLPVGAEHEQYLFSSIDAQNSSGFECLLDQSSNLVFRAGSSIDLQEVKFSTKLIRYQWYHLQFTIEPRLKTVRLEALAKARDIGELSTLLREEYQLTQALQVFSNQPLIIAGDSLGCEPCSQPVKSGSFNGKIDGFKLETLLDGESMAELEACFHMLQVWL